MAGRCFKGPGHAQGEMDCAVQCGEHSSWLCASCWSHRPRQCPRLGPCFPGPGWGSLHPYAGETQDHVSFWKCVCDAFMWCISLNLSLLLSWAAPPEHVYPLVMGCAFHLPPCGVLSLGGSPWCLLVCSDYCYCSCCLCVCSVSTCVSDMCVASWFSMQDSNSTFPLDLRVFYFMLSVFHSWFIFMCLSVMGVIFCLQAEGDQHARGAEEPSASSRS